MDEAAAAEGLSVNAWLVRAANAALTPAEPARQATPSAPGATAPTTSPAGSADPAPPARHHGATWRHLTPTGANDGATLGANPRTSRGRRRTPCPTRQHRCRRP
ncbi:hypothetical protein ACU686_34580 [Yinghuangia aomiensis]